MLRGVFHGAMRVYLDRFLNIPAAPLPGGRSMGPRSTTSEFPRRFLELLDTQQQVDPAGAMVYHYLSAGVPLAPLYRTLITALVREDADFHSFQMLEAALQQHGALGNTVAGHLMLVAAAAFWQPMRQPNARSCRPRRLPCVCTAAMPCGNTEYGTS